MNARTAIVAFPTLDAAERIESLRRRVDPQASLLAAHVTLVFPFSDDIPTSELQRHVDGSCVATPAFDVSLVGVHADAGGYVMLDVGAGAEQFTALHARLYSARLEKHLSRSHTYQPHVTVGRASGQSAAAALAAEIAGELPLPIHGRVTELALFRIGDDGTGSVLATTRLASK